MVVGQGSGGGVKPGLVIVGLLVMLVGGCLVWPSGDASTRGQAAQTTTTSPSTTSPVSLPPVPATGPTWEGRIRLSNMVGFKDGEPDSGVGTAGSMLRWTEDRLRFGVSGSGHEIGRWGGSGAPTYDQCIAVLAQEPLGRGEAGDLPWRNSEGYCMRNASKTVIVFVRPGEREGEALYIDATVWKYQEKPGS